MKAAGWRKEIISAMENDNQPQQSGGDPNKTKQVSKVAPRGPIQARQNERKSVILVFFMRCRSGRDRRFQWAAGDTDWGHAVSCSEAFIILGILDAFGVIGYTVPMISVQTKTHVGRDGMLTVQVPTAFSETDVEVLLVLQPLPAPGAQETLGWPPGFFEQTAGGWQGETLERGPQGE